MHWTIKTLLRVQFCKFLYTLQHFNGSNAPVHRTQATPFFVIVNQSIGGICDSESINWRNETVNFNVLCGSTNIKLMHSP